MCDPTYTGNQLNGNNLTGALADAPLSGHWFPAQFAELMANAYPHCPNRQSYVDRQRQGCFRNAAMAPLPFCAKYADKLEVAGVQTDPTGGSTIEACER